MKEIDKIIKSKYPPKDKNVLWDNGENLMINRNGKWESANNELPDNFKNWSGAANFLNNNDEPGGIIGMPFGYLNNSQPITFNHDGTKGIFNLGYLSNYYYGYIAAFYERSDIQEYNINDIDGINKFGTITGPIKFYVNKDHNLIFECIEEYIPYTYYFAVFNGYRKIPSKFIDFIGLRSDWNENNVGSNNYIENRTHFIEKDNYVTLQSSLISSEPLLVGTFYDEEIYYGWGDANNNPNDKILAIDKQYTNVENAEWTPVGAYGPPLHFALVYDRLYVKDTYNYSTNIEYRFYNKIYHKLDEVYIPSTIARVADYELLHIKLDISQTDSNVTTLNNNWISLTDRCVCDLYDGAYNKENALIHNGELYNGVITGINQGKFVQYDVNFETGEISEKANIDIVELYNKVEAITSNN